MKASDKIDKELLKMCLPYLTGQADAHALDAKKDRELIQYLQCVGIAGLSKDGVLMVYNSQNFLHPQEDRVSDKEKFRQLSFEQDVQIHDNPSFSVKVTKIMNEDYATIQTTGYRPIAAVRFIQDTRNPWLDVSDDTRPWDLAVIVKQEPTIGEGSPYIDGWTKIQNKKDGSSFIGFQIGGHMIKPAHLNIVVDYINDTYFDGKFVHKAAKRISYNASEKKAFYDCTCKVLEDFNGCRIELNKDAGLNIGELFLDASPLCTVIMTGNFQSSTLDFKDIKKDVLESKGLSQAQIYELVQSWFIQPRQKNKKLGKGKKQFQNTMADAMENAGIH